MAEEIRCVEYALGFKVTISEDLIKSDPYFPKSYEQTRSGYKQWISDLACSVGCLVKNG